MAHKKGVGSTDNGRDSKSKRLGVKIFGGQQVIAGNIIIRQRGTKFHAGENVYMGKDHTLHAAIAGTITFNKRKKNRTFVSVIPSGVVVEEKVAKTTKSQNKSVAPDVPVVEEVKEPIQKVASSEKIVLPSGKKVKADDLTFIEGIGPKIAELLTTAGIPTWKALSEASFDQLKEVLVNAGNRYQMHNPTTWPKQAAMAVNGEWEELEKYQDYLDGGVEPTASVEEE